jgi:signal transduction histidine kinase
MKETTLRRRLWAVSAGGAALTAHAAIVTVRGGLSPHPWAAALGRASIVAVPIGVGIYAWYRRPSSRFGWMLVAVGAGWSVTALAGSSNEVLYSTGRLAAWFVDAGFVLVILAFPSGRLSGRLDRALVVAITLVVLFGYLPTALLADDYPTPSPWTECTDNCPGNAFQVVASEPWLVAHGLQTARELLTVLIFLGVAAVLARRVATASRLMRLTLTPVLAVASMRLVIYAVTIVLRRVNADSAAVNVLAWTLALLVPVTALAFLVGLLRWRLFAGAALERLARGLDGHPNPERLRAALAEALGDPSLRLTYDGDGRVASIGHDQALDHRPELVEAAATFATMALDNHRLVAEVESSLQALQASRARLLASADEERRRIERDLHDGAQQRLVGLRIKLELAEELIVTDPVGGRALLHEIGDETVGALEEVRSLAHGVYPPLLAQRGLREAIHEATRRSPVPARLDARSVQRYDRSVESAVYFCCMEALQNVAKHASGATQIVVTLRDDGALRFEIRDDGAGFESQIVAGAGLANMRDRIEAVGGELTLVSTPGMGTRVVGSVPGERWPTP